MFLKEIKQIFLDFILYYILLYIYMKTKQKNHQTF